MPYAILFYINPYNYLMNEGFLTTSGSLKPANTINVTSILCCPKSQDFGRLCL
jgi:hypothetical protein